MRYRHGVARVQREVGAHRLGANDEQAHGVALRDRVGVLECAGHVERRHREDPLAPGTEPFPARGEDLDLATRVDDLVHEARCGPQQVLTVVEHEHKLLRSQEANERRDRVPTLAGIHTEHLEHGIGHRVALANTFELAQPRPVPAAGRHTRRDLECEARLADPAHTRERYHRDVCEGRRNCDQILFVADERRELARQVARDPVAPGQPGEVDDEIGMSELEDDLGPLQVSKPEPAELDEPDASCHPVTYKIGGRLRAQHLAGVSHRHESSSTVQRRTEVIAVPLVGYTGVQAHPRAQRANRTPRLDGQRSLPVDRSCHRRVGCREHREQSVASVLDHISAMRCHP